MKHISNDSLIISFVEVFKTQLRKLNLVMDFHE